MHPAMGSLRRVQGCMGSVGVETPTELIQSIVCGPSDQRVSATCTSAGWNGSVSGGSRCQSVRQWFRSGLQRVNEAVMCSFL